MSESEERGDLPEEQGPGSLCNGQPYELPDCVSRAAAARHVAGLPPAAMAEQPRGMSQLRQEALSLLVYTRGSPDRLRCRIPVPAGAPARLPRRRCPRHACGQVAAPAARHRHRGQQRGGLLDSRAKTGGRAAPQAAASCRPLRAAAASCTSSSGAGGRGQRQRRRRWGQGRRQRAALGGSRRGGPGPWAVGRARRAWPWPRAGPLERPPGTRLDGNAATRAGELASIQRPARCCRPASGLWCVSTKPGAFIHLDTDPHMIPPSLRPRTTLMPLAIAGRRSCCRCPRACRRR